MLSIVTDAKIVSDMTNNQKQRIMTHCLYLKKSYELVLQHMNRLTWIRYINLEILQLQDDGIEYLQSERAVRDINSHFKINK